MKVEVEAVVWAVWALAIVDYMMYVHMCVYALCNLCTSIVQATRHKVAELEIKAIVWTCIV